MPRHRRRGSRHSCPRHRRRVCWPADSPRHSPSSSVLGSRAAVAQDDVAGQLEFAAGLMPAGTIADQRCDGTWCNLGADLSEAEVHAFGIGGGCDDRCTNTARRADGGEDVSVVVAVVAYLERTRADRSPHIAERTLLTDSGFVLT